MVAVRRTDVVVKMLTQLADGGAEFTGADLVALTDYGESTIYVALGRLREAEFVTRRDETSDEVRADLEYHGNRPRAFYRITEAGRAFLNGK